MSKVLVVAPHPDDETLGCGGTLLRHVAEGDSVHWLIATAMRTDAGYAVTDVARRDDEISAVADAYRFATVHQFGYATATLDQVPKLEFIEKVSGVLKAVKPDHVYLPFPGDAHSDHRATFEATAVCTKAFRYPFVHQVWAYETLSETDQAVNPTLVEFRAQQFVEIADYLDGKINIMNLYASEVGPFPFPRSEHGIRALAAWRGAQAGYTAAEAFMLIRARQ